MKLIATNKIDTNLYELEIRVDGEEYKKALEASYKKNSKNLNIPGFRKGKAPKAMVLKMVGEEYFYDGAINATYQAAYGTALDESKLEPVDRADVEIAEVNGEGYTFKAKVTVKPEVTIEGYKGLPVSKASVSVSDEEVENELKAMADRNSRMLDVDDRAAAMGDTANIDFEGFVDGKAFEGGKGEGYSLVLGSGQFIPGFEEQIVGKNIGEEFDVNVTFPEEYHAEELKGKPAVFKTRLNSLRVKETPALDDEFAKDVSEFDTLDELKADIRTKTQERKERQAEEAVENALCDAAAEKMTVEIPHVMIERKIDEMVQDFAYRLQGQGLNINDYIKYTGADMAAFRKTFEEQAEKQVRITLALQKIAQLENLEATAEEIEAEYNKMAETYKMDVEKVKTYLPSENVASNLSLNKAIDLLKDNAVITEETPKDAE